MKLYLPSTVDATVPTLPSRYTDADNPGLWGVHAPSTARVQNIGASDSVALPFYRLALSSPSSRGSISKSLGANSLLVDQPFNYVYLPWFVAGISLSGGATIPNASILNIAMFAGSSRRIDSAGGSMIGNVGLIVPYVYILRPSTGLMVGSYLGAMIGQYPWANATSGIQVPGTWKASVDFYSHQWVSYVLAPSLWTQKNDVTVQAGDILCYEVWAMARYNALPITFTLTMETGWSGSTPTDQAYGASDNSVGGKNTFFYVDELQATGPIIPVAVPGPSNLIRVTPMAGPKVRLEFDNSTGITGPTIDAATAGLGVTGATQVDATHIDLDTDYPPKHPLGEATEAAATDENVRHW